MNTHIETAILHCFALLFSFSSVAVAETNLPPQEIDMATTLRLAGARSLDVQIAREKLAEAHANQEATTWQFFPWIAPGFAYRAHDNAIQNVEGKVLDVHRESFAIGPTIFAQLDLGDAIYKRFAAIQFSKAAEQATIAQKADTTLAAATAYIELTRAQALVGVLRETVRLAEEFAKQLEDTVATGVTLKGDALRARTQAERDHFALDQALEQQRLAGARLAAMLRLDSKQELAAQNSEFAPISLVDTNLGLDTLVNEALAVRSELRQSQSLVKAARNAKKGVTYAPWVPALGAQISVGTLGGGNETTYRGLSESEDYQVTATWRLGPGGLFDRTRIRAADARLNAAQLAGEKLHDEIVRQVVEGFTRIHSEANKLAILKRALVAAEETFRLARGRRESAIGGVFEAVVAEQDYNRVRQDYVNTIGEFNKAQFYLARSIGQLENNSIGSTANAGAR